MDESEENTDSDCEISKVLDRTWVKSRGKWPAAAHYRLYQLMVKHQLFVCYKVDPISNRKLKALLADFATYIDKTGWDSSTHDPQLASKIRGKIARIRAQMIKSGKLKQEGSDFVLRDDVELPTELEQQYHTKLQQLNDNDLNAALQRLFDLVGQTKITEIYVAWMNRQLFGRASTE